MREYKKTISDLRNFNANYEANKLTNDAADAIEELLATVPHWISVEERLPENDGCYIVAVKNDHKRRYSKTAYFSKANWFAKQDVTHWMPCPTPPKGVE